MPFGDLPFEHAVWQVLAGVPVSFESRQVSKTLRATFCDNSVQLRDVLLFLWVDDNFHESFADLSIVWQQQLRRGQSWPLR